MPFREHAKLTLTNEGTEGVSISMVYWADVLYEEPGSPAEAYESTGSDVITSAKDEEQLWMDEMDV